MAPLLLIGFLVAFLSDVVQVDGIPPENIAAEVFQNESGVRI